MSSVGYSHRGSIARLAAGLACIGMLGACSQGEDVLVLASKLEVHYRELTAALQSIRDMESAKAAIAKIKAVYPEFEKDKAALNAKNKLAFNDAERARVKGLSQDLGELMRALIGIRPADLLKFVREETRQMNFSPPPPE